MRLPNNAFPKSASISAASFLENAVYDTCTFSFVVEACVGCDLFRLEPPLRFDVDEIVSHQQS